MAVSSGTSFVLSSILTVLLFSGMQMYRQWLASSQLHTILGGYLGSVLFIFVLTFPQNMLEMPLIDVQNAYICLCMLIKTFPMVSGVFDYETYTVTLTRNCTPPVYRAVGNLESTMFGKGFQTKLFPEIILCLGTAMTASGMVHRVCTTTCFLFSLVGLYYVNRISQQTHSTPVTSQPILTKKKK